MIDVEPARCVVCDSLRCAPEASCRDYVYESCDDTFQVVRCLDCGHCYLNPRPVSSAAAIIYPSNYATFARRFSGDHIASRAKRLVTKRRMRRAGIELSGPIAILDLGCGDAQLLHEIRSLNSEARLVGIDLHFSDQTRKAMAQSEIEPIECLAEQASLEREAFDLIIMNQMIEHLWEPKEVLRRCLFALKPGGALTIETPNIEGYDRSLFASGAWGNYYAPRHLNLFSPSGLCRMLVDSGFEVSDQRYLLAPLTWIYTLKSVAARRGLPRRVGRMADDTNALLLALFSAIDLTARLFGLSTSNMKVTARRPTAPLN